ncbi:ATP-binding protein [Luteolibacter sp. LG18]|uniref:ATP-binding protein n=1 Tax=Luteolibacter sp. LG18 TaxID=2819286 RepID=UPI002B2AF609|nr:hypothetical protein llg_15040 [Luteolibacter sp. LG18]
MKPLPIRWKISAGTAAVTGASLLVFSIGSLFSFYAGQAEIADLAIHAESARIGHTHKADAFGGGWQIHDTPGQPMVLYYLVQEEDHRINGPTMVPHEIIAKALASRRPRTFSSPGGYWRAYSFNVGTRPVVVAYELVEVQEQLIELLAAFSVTMPLAIILTAVAGWIVAGRVLAPVREATEAARGIGAQALTKRLPKTSANDEIGQLTDVINDMLDRLEKGLRQAERFAADASHELRTPLTIMKGEIEGLLSLPDLPVRIEEKLVSQQEEISRLDHITERLLLLARLDAGAYTPGRQTVDFSTLVAGACEDVELLTSSRGLAMTTRVEPGCRVSGDSILLRRVVLNLLDNAAKFSPAGGSLTCTLAHESPWVRLTVSNSGPGIPEGERERIFERFYRTDEARVRAGYGLGLSLCQEIVRAHGGQIQLEEPGQRDETAFTVMLPSLPEDAD